MPAIRETTTIMNCLIPGPNVKVLGRAIVALAKVGDELYMEAKPNKLTFLTLNLAKTICAQMHLMDSFFSLYDIDKQPQNAPISCKVHVKTMLQLLKGTQLDRKLESLKIELNPNSDTIQFKLKYKVDDIVLTQVLRLMEPEVLHLDDKSAPKNNHICAGNDFYNNLLVLFSNSDDDITLEVSESKMIARNYVNGAPHKPKSVRSQVTLNSSEFMLYRISQETTINFPLKPLRAAIAFADVFNLNVGLDFDKGGSPLCITLKNPTFEMLFIVSSFNPYADGQSSIGTSLPTRIDKVNKSVAQERTQEDLLAIANKEWLDFVQWDNSKVASRTSKEPSLNESSDGANRILESESEAAKERIKLGEYLFKGTFEPIFEGNVLLRESDSE